MQHFLNAVLVYGWETISSREKYFATLILSYSSYFVAVTGSTTCNAILLKRGVSKNTAFWATIWGFGVFNYFLLKHLIGVETNGTSKDEIKGIQITQKTADIKASKQFSNDKSDLRKLTLVSGGSHSNVFSVRRNRCSFPHHDEQNYIIF